MWNSMILLGNAMAVAVKKTNNQERHEGLAAFIPLVVTLGIIAQVLVYN
jgi:hypothetical protein